MKIGIIADTHNYIPGAVYELFSGVDLIIHAGDIGQENILTDHCSGKSRIRQYGSISFS